MGTLCSRQNPLPAGRLIPSNPPVALPEQHRHAIGGVGGHSRVQVPEPQLEVPRLSGLEDNCLGTVSLA